MKLKKLFHSLLLFMVIFTMAATAAMGEQGHSYKMNITERAIPEFKGSDTLGGMKKKLGLGKTEFGEKVTWESHMFESCLGCHAGEDELITISARPDYHTECDECPARETVAKTELVEKDYAVRQAPEQEVKKIPAKKEIAKTPSVKVAEKTPGEKVSKKAPAKKEKVAKVIVSKKRVAKKAKEISVLVIPHSGEFYRVRKGDTLIKIAKKFRMHWQVLYSLNRDVIGKNPNRIFPGQSLKMPNKGVFHWGNPGADPYGNRSIKKAFDGFNLSLAVKEKAYRAVMETKGELGEIKPGQMINQMWFGRGLANNVLAAFPSPIEARIWRVEHEGYLYAIYRPTICANWSWMVEEIIHKEKAIPEKEALGESTPVQEKELSEFKSESKKVFPSVPVADGDIIDGRRLFDLYAGGGMYDNFEDHSGTYYWTKARYKPFNYELGDGMSGNWGVFGTYALGEGNDNGFGYDWNRYALGLTTSVIGKSKDFDVDFGIGQQFNDGSQGLYRSEQKDNIFLISAHSNFYERRDAGELWFPKVEANLELILPFDRDHEHSWNGQALSPDPFNNRYAEVMVTQYVYDFKFKNGVRITPGVNYGVSNEYGGGGDGASYFYQVGPAAALSYKGNDVLKLSVMNFKDGLSEHRDQQWQIFSLSLDIGGSLRAVKAAGIKEITIE